MSRACTIFSANFGSRKASREPRHFISLLACPAVKKIKEFIGMSHLANLTRYDRFRSLQIEYVRGIWRTRMSFVPVKEF